MERLKNELNKILDTGIINYAAIQRAKELQEKNNNNKIKLNGQLIEIFELLTLIEVDQPTDPSTDPSTIENKIKKAIYKAIEQKKEQFIKYIDRQVYFTNHDRLEMVEVFIYDKGIYLNFLGFRNNLNIFIDNNFKVIRKPKKLIQLERYFYNNLYIDVYDII